MQGKKRRAAWGIWISITCLLLIALTNVWAGGGKETLAQVTKGITAGKPDTPQPEKQSVIASDGTQKETKPELSTTTTADVVQTTPVKPQVDPPTTPPASAVKPAPVQKVAGMDLGRKISSLPIPNQKVVYLTFDDGPGPYTKQMVNILNANKIQGTFFWVGQNLQPGWAPYAKQMLSQGHQIGSHTMRHEAMGKRNKASQKQELVTTAAYMERLIGQKIIYFRPPYGSLNASSTQATKEAGQYLIYWHVDSRDWALTRKPQQILANIKKEVKPGSIILLHERSQTVKMLPQIIAYLKQNGYTIRTLPTGK